MPVWMASLADAAARMAPSPLRQALEPAARELPNFDQFELLPPAGFTEDKAWHWGPVVYTYSSDPPSMRAASRCVAALLDEAPGCTHCFLVHHETTTGMLNPLAAVAELCRARGVSLMVDAMSSLGGVPFDVRATPADYVISSANKCLQGMPGLAFVIADRAALGRSAEVPRRP